MIAVSDLLKFSLLALGLIGTSVALMWLRWNLAYAAARYYYQGFRLWPRPLQLSFWWDPSVWVVAIIAASLVLGAVGTVFLLAVALEVANVLRGATKLALQWQSHELSVGIAVLAVGAFMLCVGAYLFVSRYAAVLLEYYWDTGSPVETEVPEKATSLSEPLDESWVSATKLMGTVACAVGAVLVVLGVVELAMRG